MYLLFFFIKAKLILVNIFLIMLIKCKCKVMYVTKEALLMKVKELRKLIKQARNKFFKQISEEIKAKEENFELYLKDYIKEKDISDISNLKYVQFSPNVKAEVEE